MSNVIAEAIQQADASANEHWKAVFDNCIVEEAKVSKEFTSDFVLKRIRAIPAAPTTHRLDAIGPAMLRAAKKGIIKRTDRVKRSDRPESHGKYQAIWHSNVFQAGTPNALGSSASVVG